MSKLRFIVLGVVAVSLVGAAIAYFLAPSLVWGFVASTLGAGSALLKPRVVKEADDYTEAEREESRVRGQLKLDAEEQWKAAQKAEAEAAQTRADIAKRDEELTLARTEAAQARADYEAKREDYEESRQEPARVATRDELLRQLRERISSEH